MSGLATNRLCHRTGMQSQDACSQSTQHAVKFVSQREAACCRHNTQPGLQAAAAIQPVADHSSSRTSTTKLSNIHQRSTVSGQKLLSINQSAQENPGSLAVSGPPTPMHSLMRFNTPHTGPHNSVKDESMTQGLPPHKPQAATHVSSLCLLGSALGCCLLGALLGSALGCGLLGCRLGGLGSRLLACAGCLLGGRLLHLQARPSKAGTAAAVG